MIPAHDSNPFRGNALTSLLNEALTAVRQLKWQNFELLVAEGFRVQGFSVTEVASDRREEGADLMLAKGGRSYCVHCRDWQEAKVGLAAVQALYSVMLEREVTEGFLVTAGEVSEEAAALAHGRNIQFVKGPKLLAMIEKAKETITTGMPAHAPFNVRASADGGFQ